MTGLAGVILVDLAEGLGGAETRVLHLLHELPRHGLQAVLVCLADRPLHRVARAEGLPHRPLAVRGKRDPRAALRLRRLLRARPGWVVDCHTPQSQLATLVAEPGRGRSSPVLATVHSEYRHTERAPAGTHEAVLRLAHRAGWGLVAICPTVAEHLRGSVPGADPPVVWSAAPVPRPARDRERVRARLGLAPHAELVVTAARLSAPKQLTLALHTVAELAASRPQIRLGLAGDGPLRAELQRTATQLGLLRGPDPVVRLLGHRDDVPDLLAAADVCLLTSRQEGLPYTLLEAAMLRTPIVSTDAGSIGAAFPPGTATLLGTRAGPRELATAVDGLLDDPPRRARQAEAALRHVTTTFTVEATVDGTLAAYDAVARRRPGTRGGARP